MKNLSALIVPVALALTACPIDQVEGTSDPGFTTGTDTTPSTGDEPTTDTPTTGPSEPSCPDGQDGCPCYGNNSCDAGFTCEQKICVPSEPIPTTSATDTDVGSATDGGSDGDTDGDSSTGSATDTTGEPPCMPAVCSDFLESEFCSDGANKVLNGIQFLELVSGTYPQLQDGLVCFESYSKQYPQLAQEFFFLGLLKGDGFDYDYTTFPADQPICYEEAIQIFNASSAYQAPPLNLVVKVGQKDDPIKFVPINSQVNATKHLLCGPTAQDPLTQVTIFNDTVGDFDTLNNTTAVNLVAVQWTDLNNQVQQSMFQPLKGGSVTFNGLNIYGADTKIPLDIIVITSGAKDQVFRLGFLWSQDAMSPGGQRPVYQTQ